MMAREHMPMRIATIDTGLLFNETYALWHDLQARYAIHIEAIRPVETVAKQAQTCGAALWQTAPETCCDRRKVAPLHGALARANAWISAIRADQTRDRASSARVEWNEKFGLVKINPLLGWKSEDVWSYVRANQVPYSPLHDRGYPSIGCQPCTTPVQIGEDPRAGRWRGRDKTECGLHTEQRRSS